MESKIIHQPDEHGFLKHWLIAGPTERPYLGDTTRGDDAMRSEAIDPSIMEPPADLSLGTEGPDGCIWECHDPQLNVFVERSSFWHSLSHVNCWFATEMDVEEDTTLEAWLWAAGCADLYCNGNHLSRLNCHRYMYPQRKRIEIPLSKGKNLLTVRLQVLGLRDSRYLFGIQLEGRDHLKAVIRPGEEGRPSESESGGESVEPSSVAIQRGSGSQHEDRLRFHLERAMGEEWTATAAQSVLNARTTGRWDENAEESLNKTCDWVDGRPDCADFALAALLRLVLLDLVTERERERIQKTAIGFRYWPDEEGSDAMCYTSENHQLLFHSCQLLAGRLWPEEIFLASKRPGKEQEAIGLNRCQSWLSVVEEKGFREYNSSGYIPITVAAILNVADGTTHEETSARAKKQVDVIFKMLANHAFDGVVISPQGRVYREVLTPEQGGTQALLSYAVDEAVVSHHVWLGFLGSSPSYRPPSDLSTMMREPNGMNYRQHSSELNLLKARDYILTSLVVPGAEVPDDDPSLDHDRELAAGLSGYQQHLWQATLGAGCHVFVQHPGEWIDHGKARPGYWYGNGTLPRTQQRENLLMQIYDTDVEHPVPFVHAHWPSDIFDENIQEKGWRVGRFEGGYVGLWCSHPTVKCDDAVPDREWRVWSRKSAWLCVCGSKQDQADLTQFLSECLQLNPEFDEEGRRLLLDGSEALCWDR